MPDFGFVGPSYEAPSIYQDAQECINFRPEIDPTKQPGQHGVVALYPTPGLTAKIKLPDGEVRGIRTLSGGQYCVAVVAGDVYVFDSTYTARIIGSLNTNSGIVGITDNSQEVYIVDGAYRYTWKISFPDFADFVGSVSGTTLTVSKMKSGTITANQQLFGIGVADGTIITALGTGAGGVGTYVINNSQTVAEEDLSSVDVACVFTGSISGTELSVTAVTSGTLQEGQTIQGATVTAGTIITASGNGYVKSFVIASGGANYTVNDVVTVDGGIFTTPAIFVVTSTSGGAVTGLSTQNIGNYSIQPTNPVSTTSNGQGTGLTLTLTFGTGEGTTGTYIVTPSQTVTSRTLYALNFSVLPITDGAFSGADVVDVVDNLFVYNRPETQQFGCSNLLSPISNGLNFSSKDGAPDDLVSLIVNNREVYLLGEYSSEVWVNAGLYPFPFQRIPGTSTQHGIAAKASVARLANTFAYVARNYRGQAEIVMMNGYVPTRISTHAVENSILDQEISDAVAWTYQLEGHEVYVVTFPSVDLTWAYDISTGMWHKWLWTDTETGEYHRHRGNCVTSFQNVVLVGDWENGTIYQLDQSNYTDNGSNVRRLRRALHLVTDLQRQYFDEFQIQFQPGVGLSGHVVGFTSPTNGVAGVGVAGIAIAGQNNFATVGADPQAMLRWSNDGGSTWSNEHWTSIGLQGKYKNRAIWRRLGMARDRIFEVSVTDPVKAVIVSANLKASIGDN